jgi:hypothetical protein
VRHDIWLMGLQCFPYRRMYVRTGLGVALLEASTAGDGLDHDTGLSLELASGWELLRLRHAALGVEAGVDTIEYPEESWYGAHAALTVTLF